MGSAAARGSMTRYLAGVVGIGAMWWIAFEHGDRIPLLTYVNLAIHEAGHQLSSPLSHLTYVLMGSIAQVGVPLLFALYFLLLRNDWMGAGLCLAWSATSALEVSAYVADAPKQELELIGGSHDWAYILGPHGYHAMDQAKHIADTIRDGAWAAIAIGLALAVGSGFRRRGHADAAASARRATATSSP